MKPIDILRRRGSGSGSGGVSTFATEVMADTPWAWWKLDENTSATSVSDSSGNARHLNTFTVASGKRQQTPLTADGGYSMLFDGGVASGGLPGFSGHNPLTFEMIVKPVSLSAARVLIHNGSLTTFSESGQFLAINTSGGIYFQVVAGGAFRTLSSDSGAISAGETAIIGVSHDPLIDKVIIYKNGSAIKTLSHTFGLADVANSSWKIGDLSPASNIANSYLDHVLVFASVLSPTRFLAHAEAAGFA